MAKNCLKQKKRIAHFQMTGENKNDNESTGYLDYVSNIIQTMDTGFNSIQSNYSIMQTKFINTEEENSNSSNKPSSSHNKSISQNSKNLGKKLSISRKFPLMEKSQKILKQLKHNRNFSKPRAHLAALPSSPCKETIKDNLKIKNIVKESSTTRSVSNVQKIVQPKPVSQVKDNSNLGRGNALSKVSNSKSNHISNTNFKNTCKVSKKSQNVPHTAVKNVHFSELNECFVNENKFNMEDSITDVKSLENSDNEESDGEFEKFIMKNKKALKKKEITSKKQSTAKRKALVKKPKNKLQRKNNAYSDHSDSEDNGYASLSCNSKNEYSSKKRRISRIQSDTDTENINEESLPDMSMDIPMQDSSSESDTDNNKTCVTGKTVMSDVKCNTSTDNKTCVTGNTVMSDAKCVSNEVCNYAKPQEISLNAPKQEQIIKGSQNVDSEESDIEIVDVVPTALKNECQTVAENGTLAALNVTVTEKVVIPDVKCNVSIGVSKNEGCNYIKSKEISIGAPKQEQILIKCVQNVDSEESDIEIVEVVQTNLKPVVAAVPDCMVVSCKEENPVVERVNVKNVSSSSSPLVTKTERGVDTCNIGSVDNKSEAVYLTDICRDNIHKLVNVESSSKYVSVDRAEVKTGVKSENDSDDEIVVLDTVQTNVKTESPSNLMETLKCVKNSAHKILMNNNSSQSLCNSSSTDWRNRLIKNEQRAETSTMENSIFAKIKNPSVTDELKFCEGSQSRTFHKEYLPPFESNEEINNRNKIDEISLIEVYKKEFQAYQDIVKTEETVSASLKMLEVRQAQKLQHIRSLVQKYIGADHVVKDSLIKKDALGDLLKSSSKLASKPDCEIKPNIPVLQNVELLQQSTVILKQEPKSEDYLDSSKEHSTKKQTLKLLNERCNVCGKDAKAACQGCAKVFFCSNECGRKFWNDGHANECDE